MFYSRFKKEDFKKALKVINAFDKGRVLVVGDLMLDEFIWGTVDRISPEAPIPVVWEKKRSFMAGGAANVAMNIASVGGRPALCGIVGNDEYGRLLLKAAQQNGIDTSAVIAIDERQTIVKTRVIAHHQQVVRVDREDITPLPKNIVSRLTKQVIEKMDDVDAIIFEDYGKGVISRGLLKALMPTAKRKGKVITVDPKKDHFGFYKGVDTVTPNKKELSEAVGMQLKDVSDVDKAAMKLIKRLSLQTLLVTLSEDGMKLFYKDGKTVHIPTAAKEVYDVSGAGDTVIAIFTLSRVSGADPFIAALTANIAAGIVVGKLGVAATTREEIIREMEQRL